MGASPSKRSKRITNLWSEGRCPTLKPSDPATCQRASTELFAREGVARTDMRGKLRLTWRAALECRFHTLRSLSDTPMLRDDRRRVTFATCELAAASRGADGASFSAANLHWAIVAIVRPRRRWEQSLAMPFQQVVRAMQTASSNSAQLAVAGPCNCCGLLANASSMFLFPASLIFNHPHSACSFSTCLLSCEQRSCAPVGISGLVWAVG